MTECCCDPPNVGLEWRYTPPDSCLGCESNADTDILIPAMLSGIEAWLNTFCLESGTDYTEDTVSTTYGNGSYVNTAPTTFKPAVAAKWDACVDNVNSITVRIQCGAASTTATYTKTGGSDCLGEYTRSGSSTIFPATITVSAP